MVERVYYRLRHLLVSLEVLLFAVLPAIAAKEVDFAHRSLLAGKALLTADGFEISRTLGVAAFAPEFKMPVELVYDSSVETTGIFGFCWHSPQLESCVRREKDCFLWQSPWKEKIRFYSKKEKMQKNVVEPAPIAAAKRGRGFYAPYSCWEADANSEDLAKIKTFTIRGKKDCSGWEFSYCDGKLAAVTTPYAVTVEFNYDISGRLQSITSQKTPFVELEYLEGRVSQVRINGIPTVISYCKMDHVMLQKTIEGLSGKKSVMAIASVRQASLDVESFSYEKGYLANVERGAKIEKFIVQTETRDERIQNLKSKDKKANISHTGKIAGRLLFDGDLEYSYANGIQLKNKVGDIASFSYDEKNGIYKSTGFDGQSRTTYCFMRQDVAYLGKVRKVVDGRGRDLVAFRYDKMSGKPIRVTDILGNKRLLEYDERENCTKLSRRADWSPVAEPVRSFAYDRNNRLTEILELDEDGNAVRKTTLAYARSGRPAKISDGRRTVTVSYTPSGFPALVKDDFTSVSLEYDCYNRLVAVADPYGVVTRRTYAGHGGIAKLERKDGNETLSSVVIGYDGRGLPVSVTDQDGRTTACDRDILGRIIKEKYANATEVAYAYDKIGRLATVIDENGHEIKFGWDRLGISSRLTAAGQLTHINRDANGLVASVAASKNCKTDRTIRREYDEFDRVTKIDYGNNEIETFAYDEWGRLASHARGNRTETYVYDHFGRLIKRNEDGIVYNYAYDAYGNRVSFKASSQKGEIIAERRRYDRYGRLIEIASLGSSVKYRYDAKGRIAQQVVDGLPIDFAYTKYGRLAGKYWGGKQKPEAMVEYEYSKSGHIIARTANDIRQTYEYDGRGQLLAVKENGIDVERYVYDKAGNMLKKMIRGKTATFAFDGANQLVSSTTDGITTEYAYDAAGRLVKEGHKTYRYGYLDKVLSVTDGNRQYAYEYHVDGQLAHADYGSGKAEDFAWDGLALILRGDERFLNEPHVGGGNPVVSSMKRIYFNDILGTTIGAKKDSRYYPAAITAFGETLETGDTHFQAHTGNSCPFFTGKPQVEGLGYAFLFRNYRATLAKWQTADPLGYPDGWNQLAYCRNTILWCLDCLGAACTKCCTCEKCNCGIWAYPSLYGDGQHYFMGREGIPIFNPEDEIMNFVEDNFPEAHYFAAIHDSWVDKLVSEWGLPDILFNIPTMPAAYIFAFMSTSYDMFADFINYLQDQFTMPNVQPFWLSYCDCKKE